ncbi:EAL domain-containing protein [Qipengyuania sp. JC766]|uniref:putative bifunctional diguanylate cyclase/phosphodiesterase n=1 Tax=Qipengyuania sp. JC766 TaxID=3232139 RepID=UPI003458C491
MSGTNPKQASEVERLPRAMVLGFSAPKSGDESSLRTMQYQQFAKSGLLRILLQALGAVLTAWACFKITGPLLIGVWSVLLVAAIAFGLRNTKKLGEIEFRSVERSDVRRQLSTMIVTSFVWCMPIIAISIMGSASDLALVWGIVACLMVAAALFQPFAPLSTIVFASLTGLVGTGCAVYLQRFDIALLFLTFASIVTVGALKHGRTFMVAHLARVGVAEQEEVVSMLLREFEENQADWLWQIDVSRRIRSVSPRFAYALGRLPEQVEGQPFLQQIAGESWESGEFSPTLRDLAERIKSRENFSNLIVLVVINGEERWWELSGTPIHDDYGAYAGFRGVGSDVTEQRKSNEKIAYLARYDTLTGLPNRLMLNEALRDALKFSEKWRTRCAFLMLDLDRFKAVNDSLGHMVGDQMLAEVSERLKDLMDENAICGRLGGDEFAIVIRDASDRQVVDKLARSMISRLSQPYDIDNHTLYVGASVGSAIGPRDGKTVEELMRNADLALYRAKDDGGGAHFQYEPTLHKHAEERRQLEASLRHAIAKEELVLNYQPVVDANNEQLVSFEALVRWNSRDHGFVSPGKFIPLAEDTRLIVPIGTWVLEEACREAVKWPPHVRVAVNVSAEQLIEPDFTTTVVRALSASGLQAHRLEIEVTESIFLRDADIASTALQQVMDLGCTVALDDFGTGYSSLGYLRKLSFSTIKVDRTFVQGAAQKSAESIAIIRAVVAMADSLGMSTTAEGVEDAEEAEMVRTMGCTKIQGYYFGRPMAADDVQDIFRQPRRPRERISA